MRVCVYARMYSHFAEVSKIAQDAARAGTQAPEQEHRNTSDHHKSSTRAGAHPQERERDQSERTSARV